MTDRDKLDESDEPTVAFPAVLGEISLYDASDLDIGTTRLVEPGTYLIFEPDSNWRRVVVNSTGTIIRIESVGHDEDERGDD